MTADEVRARIDVMRADLEPMSAAQAMGYGRKRFHGPAFDGLFTRLSQNPDGSPPDVPQAADELIGWCDRVIAFALQLKAKA